MAAYGRRSVPFVAFSAIASCAAAQPPGGSRSDQNMSFSDVMTISFFMAIFFPVFVVLLAFACLRLFRPPDEPPRAESSASEWSRGHKEGLDATEIAELPLVSYRDVKQHRISGGGGSDDPLECAVCLLEFEDDDSLRLLPTCPHAFHPECIGLWLEKHVTCPLCRASVLDPPAPVLPPEELLQPPNLPLEAPSPPDSPPVHDTVVLIDGPIRYDHEEDYEGIRILAIGMRREAAAGRQQAPLPRSNSTGHERAGGMERFALRLPEHVRLEILISHRLRHVTSAVASVRVREGSAHDAGAGGGSSVRNAVARLVSLFAPGAGWKGDDEDISGVSSRRRRDESARGAAEDKRSD